MLGSLLFKKRFFIIAGIAATAIIVGVVYFIATNTAAAKLAKEFNQALEIKNHYQLDKLSLVQPAKDNNSVEVKIGDNGASEFVPNLEISRWDREISFKLKPDISAVTKKDKTLKFDGEKVKFGTPKIDYQYYDIPANEEYPEGAYEFEAILKEKPATNKVEIPIETQNLDFFYQPPLTQLWKVGDKDGRIVKVSETQCLDKDGKALVYQDENNVGSYAVYYKDGKSGDYSQMGGKNYMTGKAFHIYRPQIIDAQNNKVWGQLNIDTANNKLAVTIPQDFLDKAVYPVTVDPTFGYTTIGAGNDSGSDYFEAYKWTMAAHNGTASNIKLAAWDSTASGHVKLALYTHNSSGNGSPQNLVANSSSGALTVTQTAKPTQDSEWTSGSISASLSASTIYWLAMDSENNNVYWAYDSYGSDNYRAEWGGSQAYSSFPFDPAPALSSHGANAISMYVTYPATTPAACGYGPCSGLVGYWSFNGSDINWSTNMAYDRSGEYNDGTITNMSTSTSPVAGISGQALSFDGVDDRVATNLLSNFITASDGTISVWVKPQGNPQTAAYYDLPRIIVDSDGTSAEGYILISRGIGTGGDAVDRIWLQNWDGTDDHLGISYNVNEWVHIVWVHTGGNLYGYKNGALVTSVASGNTTSLGHTLNIGGDPYGTTGNFNGSIDEVRVYNRGLAASEITQLYQYGAAEMRINTPITQRMADSSLMGNWTFNGQDMAGPIGNLLHESFEGTGYENSGWVETIGAGSTVDEDSAGPGSLPTGGGSQVLYCNSSTGNDAQIDNTDASPPTNTKLYGRFYYYLDSTTPGSGFVDTIVAISNSDWSRNIAFSLQDGGTSLWFEYANGQIDTKTVSLDTWYRVEFKYDIDNLSWEWKVNGVSEGSGSLSGLTYPANLRWYEIGFIKWGDATSAQLYFDLVDFDTTNWIGEGEEMVAVDRSGSNHNGNVLGGANPVPGINGQALSFDGVDDEVLSRPLSSFISPSVGTISFWVKPRGSALSNAYYNLPMIITPDDATSDCCGMIITRGIATDRSSLDRIWLANWDTNYDVVGIPYNVDEWVHIVWLHSGGVLYGYKNGVFIDSVSSGDTEYTIGQKLNIGGKFSGSASDFFTGLIDEVRIYNRALSESEILQLYQYGAAEMRINTPITQRMADSSLVGNWTFNGQDTTWTSATAGTTNDLSGNNNTGTITNMSRSSSPAPGINGQALNFDGVDDIILLPAIAMGGNTGTIGGWVKSDSANPGNRRFLGRYYDQHSIGISDETPSDKWGAHWNDTVQYCWDTPVDTNWHHVMVTYDGSISSPNIRMYIDGIRCDTTEGVQTGDNINEGEVWKIGNAGGGAYYWDGLIDEVRIYNRALTASEILQLYQTGSGGAIIKQ